MCPQVYAQWDTLYALLKDLKQTKGTKYAKFVLYDQFESAATEIQVSKIQLAKPLITTFPAMK